MSASAHAQSAEVYFEVKDTQPPSLAAMVVDAPRLPANRITLHEYNASDPGIHPIAVRTFAEGDEPIAIALVVCGQELFAGNDEIETDENARYPGVLEPLVRGIDTLHLDKLGPTGSTITVISYDTGAAVRTQTIPLEMFHGRTLGSQHDYRGRIGTDLVAGVELAIRQLDASDAPHKLMLVIGDGNDTNNEAAKSQLRDLKKRAARSHISTAAIIYKTVVSAEGEVISALTPAVKWVSSVDGITAALGERLDKATNISYLTFVDDRLPWDGRDHDLVIRLDHDDLDPATMTMPDLRSHTPWWHGRFAQIGIGVLLVGLLIGAAKIRA